MTITTWWQDCVASYRLRRGAKRVVQAETPPPPVRILPPRHMIQSAADSLDWMCKRLHATYAISRLNDGVVVWIELPDHSRISSGLAASVAVAVAQLETKLNATK